MNNDKTTRPATSRYYDNPTQHEDIEEFLHDWALRNGDPTSEDAELIFRFVSEGIALATAEELG